MKSEKVVFKNFSENTVDDKKYITLYFLNEVGNKEAFNYVGVPEELINFVDGDFINVYYKIYRSKENFYKIIGVSIYKIEKF